MLLQEIHQQQVKVIISAFFILLFSLNAVYRPEKYYPRNSKFKRCFSKFDVIILSPTFAHVLCDDVNRLFRDDSVELHQLVMSQFLHDLSFLQE